MPRLPAKLVEEREAFARSLFAKGMDVKKANEEIARKYDGVKMNPVRLAEIQTECKLTKLHAESRGLPGPSVEKPERADVLREISVPGSTVDVSEASKADALAYSTGLPPAEAKRSWDSAIRKIRELEIDLDDPHVKEVMSAHITAGKPSWGIFDL